MKLHLIFLTGIFLLICSNAEGQTTIVAVRTPTEIVVGADSKGTSGDMKSTHMMCKIGQVGDFLFAYAGHGGDAVTGFDPAAIARNVGSAQGTILEKSKRFEELVKDPLVVSLTLLRQINPQLFKINAEDVPPLEVIFFGVENRLPMLYRLTCKASINSSGAVEVATELKTIAVESSSSEGIVVLGQRKEIDTVLEAYPNFWAIGLIDGVRWLVTLEAIFKWPVVGTPVDLVHVDRVGVHWVQRKSECKDKKKQSKLSGKRGQRS